MVDRNRNILINQALEENADAMRRSVDPIMRLSTATGDLKSVQEDNISEVRYLRNSLLQQTNVTNKLKESINKADKINVKALGQSVTLQKVISKNRQAVENSTVGYLRAAEAFVDNFGAGIRQTQGGTLKLTEQLILTGQDLTSFREVNKTLLGATGRNYNSLSELNNSILESANTYQISTSELLKGIQLLQKDINQFALFGPDVAGRLSVEFEKVTARLQGLGEGQISTFMGLFKGGLQGRGLRELMGLQDFGQAMSRGAVNAQQIEGAMMKAGSFIMDLTSGEEFDVAIEKVKAVTKLNEDQAANMVMLARTVFAGPDIQADMASTQEEMAQTIENQTQLANKFYQSIAPKTLEVTTALLVPILQTAQAVNFLAGSQGGIKSLFNIAGGPDVDSARGGSSKAGKKDGLLSREEGSAALDQLLGSPKSSRVKKTKDVTKGFARIFDQINKRKPSLGAFARSPIAGGMLSLGGNLLAGQLDGDETMSGRAVGGASDFLGMRSVAQTLVPGLTNLKGGILGTAVGALTPLITDQIKGDSEEGSTRDTVADIASMGLQGAAYGALLGPLGAAIGGGLGIIGGGIMELIDLDEDAAKREQELLRIQKKKEAEEAAAKAARKINIQKSDFVLMNIVDSVKKSYEATAATSSNQKILEVLERIEGLQATSNQDARQAAVDSNNTNKNKP